MTTNQPQNICLHIWIMNTLGTWKKMATVQAEPGNTRFDGSEPLLAMLQNFSWTPPGEKQEYRVEDGRPYLEALLGIFKPPGTWIALEESDPLNDEMPKLNGPFLGPKTRAVWARRVCNNRKGNRALKNLATGRGVRFDPDDPSTWGRADFEMDMFVAGLQCHRCRRYFSNGRCEAFPKGIPFPVFSNEHDHRTPYEGDGGLTFLPIDVYPA